MIGSVEIDTGILGIVAVTPARASDLVPSVRMLDVAEQITTLIETGVWTWENFPRHQEIEDRLSVGHPVMRGAVQVLIRRGVLADQIHREGGVSRRRVMPVLPEGCTQGASAAERVWARIEARLASGHWGPGNFPMVEQIAAEFGCACYTVSRALRLGQDKGLVRKIRVLRPPPSKGTQPAWIAVSSDVDPTRPPVRQRMREAITRGEWTGPLPKVSVLARRLRVNDAELGAACRDLAREGLLRRVWLPDFSACVWYVIDGFEPDWLPPGEGGKAVAIAADLARHLHPWLVPDAARGWARRRLPPVHKLARRYRAGYTVMNRALELLAVRGILERVVASDGAVEFWPVPPRPRTSSVPSGIPAAARNASSNWPRRLRGTDTDDSVPPWRRPGVVRRPVSVPDGPYAVNRGSRRIPEPRRGECSPTRR